MVYGLVIFSSQFLHLSHGITFGGRTWHCIAAPDVPDETKSLFAKTFLIWILYMKHTREKKKGTPISPVLLLPLAAITTCSKNIYPWPLPTCHTPLPQRKDTSQAIKAGICIETWNWNKRQKPSHLPKDCQRNKENEGNLGQKQTFIRKRRGRTKYQMSFF